MLENCNALGAIVTCGGTGLLIGASISAWLFGCAGSRTEAKLERERRKRLDANRRLEVALDDLSGVPSSDDVRLARATVEGVVTMLSK